MARRQEWSPARPRPAPPPAVTLLAPTTSSKVPRALREGLTKPFDAYDAEDVADVFARQKGEERGEPGAVLEVTVSGADLYPEWKAYEDPPFRSWEEWGVEGDDEWLAAVREGRIPLPAGPRDWKTSLDVVHTARHVGRVAPENVRIAWRLP